MNITNDLIENYEKVKEGKEPELEPEPDTTELRLMNEIRAELSDQRMELQSILEKICGIAEARFARCKEMDYRAINQMIKRELSLYPRSKTVNPSLLKTITKRIQIYPDRSISIELINGYTAREVTMCVHASTGSISAN